jgi:hypothetical protein
MAIYSNDRDPNEEMWERQNKLAEGGWNEIFRKWISETTKFQMGNFVDWLKENYEIPKKKSKSNL